MRNSIKLIMMLESVQNITYQRNLQSIKLIKSMIFNQKSQKMMNAKI